MNPIIQRELVGVLRTGRALWLQVGLVAALGLLVLARWPSDALVDLSGQQAQQVLRLFGYGLMVCVMLLAPVFPATTIVRERLQGTMPLLLNSPMTPLSILAGKLIGVLGFAVILLLLSLPAAAACYAMGGIDASQLFWVYGILFLMALQYASLGLVVSSFANSVDAALRLTFGLILILAIFTLGPHQFLVSLVSPATADLLNWIRAASPIPAMMEALGQGGVASRGFVEEGNLTRRFAVLAVVSTVAFLVWTLLRLDHRLVDRPRKVAKATEDRTLAEQRFRRLIFLIDPQRRTKPIGPLTNPVMIKEFRTRKFGRSYWLIRLIGAALVVSLGLMLVTSWSTIDWGAATMSSIIAVMQFALLVLVTPALASSLISSERESGGWQLMQVTPLSPLTILMGKLMSAGWTLLLLMVGTLPAYGMMYYIESVEVSRIPGVIVTLLLATLFALLLSAAVSSLFRRTAPATVTSYALLVGLCAGTMLFWFGQDAVFTHTTVQRMLQYNPLAAALTLLDAPGFRDYNLVPANWWIMGIGSAVCFLILLVQTWRISRPQ